MGNTVDSGIKINKQQVLILKTAIRGMKTLMNVLQSTITSLEACLPK
jgi:hypothetical protein